MKGDSFTRQEELITKYEKEKGIEIDDELRIRDPGVAAFTGENIREGKLGLFLQAIKDKKVAVGSVLILESLDRLTRMKPRQSLPLFLDIINAGVTIVTLADQREHSTETIDKDNGMVLYGSLMALTQAHEESKRKSERLKSAWIGKRKNITKAFYTSRIPSWLKLSEDKIKIEAIAGKANVVKRMFDLCLAGHHAEGIARMFHREDVPVLGSKRSKSWSFSFVGQTLRNPAVTGEFTPHRMENGKRVAAGPAIPNYYPQIVTREQFNRVQHIMDSRSKNKKGGRISSKSGSIFRKLLFCGYCGSPVYRTAKGRYYKGETRRTLLCRKAKEGTGCFYVGWEYDEFEKAFLTAAPELRHAVTDKFDGKALRVKLESLMGEEKEVTDKINSLISIAESAGGSAENAPAVLLERIVELEDRRNQIKTSRVANERKLSAGMGGTAPTLKLEVMLKKLTDDETRRMVRDLMSQIFERIDLFPAGSKFQLAKLKLMHKRLVKKWGKADGHVSAHIREHFDRRKVRFFQPVLNLPGVKKRLTFSTNGKLMPEVRLDLVEDVPDDAEIAVK